MKKIKCKVCEVEFIPESKERYTSRDVCNKGLAAAFTSEQEPVCYDTFDCPQCGCQNVVNERKRMWTGVTFKETRETIGDYVDDEDIEGEDNEKTE